MRLDANWVCATINFMGVARGGGGGGGFGGSEEPPSLTMAMDYVLLKP